MANQEKSPLMRFVTLADVARKVGVSMQTVSRAINRRGYVKEETARRIFEAIESLNYQPAQMGKSLRYLRSDLISMIIPDIANNFYANVVKSAERMLRANGKEIMVFTTNYDSSLEEKFLQISLSRRVEGIIISTIDGSRALLEKIARINGVPVVIIENYFEDLPADYVLHEERQGAYLLAEHLIKVHGHREIGYISTSLVAHNPKERLEGFKQALAEYGVPFDQKLLRFGGFEIEDGYRMTKELFSGPRRPTALFSETTIFMTGVLIALKELGLRIPEDVAVVTFDDYDFNEVMNPALTTLRRIDRTYGEKAANLILHRLRGAGVAGNQVVQIPTSLVVRESCGC